MCKDRQKSGFGRMSGRFSRTAPGRNRKNGESGVPHRALPPPEEGRRREEIPPEEGRSRPAQNAGPAARRHPPHGPPHCPPRFSYNPASAVRQPPPHGPPLALRQPFPHGLPRFSGTQPLRPATENLSKNNKFFLLLKFFWLYLPSKFSENTKYPQKWICSQ